MDVSLLEDQVLMISCFDFMRTIEQYLPSNELLVQALNPPCRKAFVRIGEWLTRYDDVRFLAEEDFPRLQDLHAGPLCSFASKDPYRLRQLRSFAKEEAR